MRADNKMEQSIDEQLRNIRNAIRSLAHILALNEARGLGKTGKDFMAHVEVVYGEIEGKLNHD